MELLDGLVRLRAARANVLVQELKEKEKISVAYIAEKCKVSPNTVYQWLNNKTKPQIRNYRILAEIALSRTTPESLKLQKH
ncbi:helix-turn-helix domain-containing protein [Patescibacteria group bacterium]|nr:helix-turn-helix domain-containing protein [Patescibacteria group bacterium]